MSRREKHFAANIPPPPNQPNQPARSIRVLPLSTHHGEFYCDFDYRSIFYHVINKAKRAGFFSTRLPITIDNEQVVQEFVASPGKDVQRR